MSTFEDSDGNPVPEVTFAREGVQLLPAGALRLRHAVFQSVTNMAPAAAIVYDFPAQALAAGAAMALSNVIALAGVILIAFSVIEFARKLPSAGGYFTYISRGLGPHTGAYTGWTFFLYSMVLPAEVTIIWAGITQALVLRSLHIHVSWIVFEAIMVGVVGFFGYTGVRRSARTAMIAGSIEILIFIALSIGWLVHPASPVNLKPFLPSSSPTGWAGVLGFGLVFGILNFVGFEAAAPLGDETREPQRHDPRAVMGAAIAIGLVYVFVSYASVFGWGISGVATRFATNAAPYNVLASRLWGPAWIFVYLAITNSSLACSLAISNQASRVLYAMGRIDLLPKALGKVHPTHNTPYRAVVIQAVATLAIAVTAGLIWGTLSGFLVLATTLTIGAIVVYALGNVALTLFYRREHRSEFSVVKHLALPLIALALLVYVLYRTIWPVPPYPLNVPAYLSIAWLALGFGVVLYLSRRARGGLRDAGKLFVEGEPANIPAPPAGQP